MISVLVAGAVLFQHLSLFTVAGFEVTLGHLLSVPLLVMVTRRYRVTLLAAVWPILILLTAAAAAVGDPRDGDRYFSTLLLFLASTAILVAALGGVDWATIGSARFTNSLWICLMLLSALSVAQVALGAAGHDGLFNLFGSHQYLHPYDPQLAYAIFPRAQGLFLEPSYDAYVIGALTVSLISLGRRTTSSIGFGIAGLLACQSATGLVLLAMVLLLAAFRARLGRGVVVVLLGSLVLGYSGDYLAIRLSSIGTDGSSAYYRFVAPLAVLKDVLADHPLGMTLGSVKSVILSYGLNMEGVHASSLDNGMYVLVFYFGWLGVLLLLGLLAAAVRAAVSCAHADQSLYWIAPIWLVSSLLFTGSIMAPEFALMTWLVIVTFRARLRIVEEEEEENESHRDVVEHHHRHLPGPGRADQNAPVTVAAATRG